jgi:hypothetical protein
MALEKFVPLSPDPNITTDSDMKLAQFGHLNTIVDYLNAYVVVDSLQLAGSGPITATARYISDSTGVNSAISISTGNIGIGTDIPTYKFVVSDSSGNDGPVFFEKNILGGQSDCYVYNKNASTNFTTGQLIGTFSFGAYFNSAYSPSSQDVAAIYGLYRGDGTNRKGQLQFRTHDSSGMQAAMTINENQLVGVGETSPTARLHVKGKGSTSATTSLLVQNSAGNSALTISDDLNANFQGRIQIEYDKISFLGNPSNTYIQQNMGIGYMYYSSAQSHQIMINAQPKIIVKDTGASQASILIVGHNVATSAIADASALLEVRSDATYLKGFLKPRMTTTQKNAIVTPAAGLEIFDTTLGRPCFYSGSAWVTL